MNVENILKLVQSGDLDIAEATRLLEEDLAVSPSGSAASAIPSISSPSETVAVRSENAPSAHYTDSAPAEHGIDDTLGYAQLDVLRAERTGFPEVVYGEGKTPEQLLAIMEKLAAHADLALATRVSPDKAAYVLERRSDFVYHETARALTWQRSSAAMATSSGYIAVVCAGTADVPVAEEAAVTAETFGCRVERVYDVGVAGIHRLFRRLPLIRGANAIVVVAGMEGALASVVGGLVAVPVFAVPTSIGYGASFQGVAALLAMLNACAPGISVVNIDNGFGAGYNAALIQQNRVKRDQA